MSILLAFLLILAVTGSTAAIVALRALGQPILEEHVTNRQLTIYAVVICVGLLLLGVFT